MLLGVKENMWWKYFCVFLSLVIGIYCENWFQNDQTENDQVTFQHRSLNGYYRQNVKSHATTSALRYNQQFISDAPSMAESIPFDGGDRKPVRRTNLRRRKMGSSNKKSIFRRGQRHRHNKNGNSFFKTTNQFFFASFLLSLHSPRRVYIFFCSLHNQRAITNRFNLGTRVK